LQNDQLKKVTCHCEPVGRSNPEDNFGWIATLPLVSWIIGGTEKRGFPCLDGLGRFATRRPCQNPLARNDRVGFTLAEVLITLGIIGVVAALTMPSLIANYKEKETITRLKKVYSVLQNAFIQAQNEHGSPTDWELAIGPGPVGTRNLYNILIKDNIKISKYCDNTDTGCFSNKIAKYPDGVNLPYSYVTTNIVAALLVDGVAIGVDARSLDCTFDWGGLQVCGIIHIDLNGKKAPNQIGQDTFEFAILKDKIVPADLMFTENGNCKNTNIINRKTRCVTSWAVINENMDYLHCDDLSWDGKITCK
jgi:prepilin-type N-terminal cleavage/methylation domain-containing protein